MLALQTDNFRWGLRRDPSRRQSSRQDLADRCYALAETRAARHRAVFRARLDLETFHRQFLSALPALPVDFESDLDKLVGCCSDVINVRACVPRLTFVLARVMPPDLTFDELQLDLNSVEEVERAVSGRTHPRV